MHRQPDDPGQQIVENHYHNGNGMFAKFQHAVIIALALAIGSGLWTMNARLTRVETLLEVLATKVK